MHMFVQVEVCTCASTLSGNSLVPRPLPDFISQPPRLWDKIWEWPGDEARVVTHHTLMLHAHAHSK